MSQKFLTHTRSRKMPLNECPQAQVPMPTGNRGEAKQAEGNGFLCCFVICSLLVFWLAYEPDGKRDAVCLALADAHKLICEMWANKVLFTMCSMLRPLFREAGPTLRTWKLVLLCFCALSVGPVIFVIALPEPGFFRTFCVFHFYSVVADILVVLCQSCPCRVWRLRVWQKVSRARTSKTSKADETQATAAEATKEK